MAWQDRIREAAYKSPSGVRTVFAYEDVSRVVEKKTAVYDFPDADGSLVQDLGRKGRRYPLRVFFHGDDHDTQADAFERALLERGVGVLEHPRYGAVGVVPFGEITQRDDLKTNANQTVLEVVFWETIGASYPAGVIDGPSEALANAAAFALAAPDELAESARITTQFERVTMRDQWSGFVNDADRALAAVAGQFDSVARRFATVASSINTGLDVIIDDPVSLAAQTLVLLGLPATVPSSIETIINAYGLLSSSITTSHSGRIGTGGEGSQQVIPPTNDNRAANELASRLVFARGAVSGSVTSAMLAVQNGRYRTRAQAIAAADSILDQFGAVSEWAEANYNALDGTGVEEWPAVDTGDAYQALSQAVSIAAGELVRHAFSLSTVRRVTLDRNRSLFDFVAEYYGGVDDNLDFFIETNALSGSEILELPKGREVLVYV